MGYTLCDDDLEQIANFFTYRLYDILFRRQTLLWAAQWAQRTGRTFKLYGKGWARDPDLGQYAVGPLEHGEDLRCAYRYAKRASVPKLQIVPTPMQCMDLLEKLIK